jgi:pimeloyl-ACP methyl ester carboxylesterase
MPNRGLSRRAFLGAAASATVAGVAPAAVPRGRRAKEPRHFVLVHGAWHGAWCWYKIVAGLQDAGHRVAAIDLPSAGIDGTLPGSVSLQTQAERVIATLDAVAEPVILVGHSAGGAPVSLAAEARPDAVEKLVYLAAFLLPNGASIALTALADESSTLSQHFVVHPDGTFDVDPTARRDIFYNHCDDRDVALAQSLLKPVSLQANVDPVVIGENYGRVRRFYVTCLRDHAVSPATQRAMYTAMPCEKVLSLRSDHSPFLSHPAALLRALAAIARA